MFVLTTYRTLTKNNAYVDVDNATRSGETVFQVSKGAKSDVLAIIDKCIELHPLLTSNGTQTSSMMQILIILILKPAP